MKQQKCEDDETMHDDASEERLLQTSLQGAMVSNPGRALLTGLTHATPEFFE